MTVRRILPVLVFLTLAFGPLDIDAQDATFKAPPARFADSDLSLSFADPG